MTRKTTIPLSGVFPAFLGRSLPLFLALLLALLPLGGCAALDSLLALTENPAHENTGSPSPNQPKNTKSTGRAVAATAAKYTGIPYVWGGTTPKGFDCSGLIYYAYKQHGVTIPRVSKDQAKCGRAVARNDLRPGDIIYFTTNSTGTIDHVAIYIGNDMLVHAPNPSIPSEKTALSTYNDRFSGRYMGARRVLEQ